MIILSFSLAYLVIGAAVLRRNLETRFLRPLTAAEMLNVVLTWWRWL